MDIFKIQCTRIHGVKIKVHNILLHGSDIVCIDAK